MTCIIMLAQCGSSRLGNHSLQHDIICMCAPESVAMMDSRVDMPVCRNEEPNAAESSYKASG